MEFAHIPGSMQGFLTLILLILGLILVLRLNLRLSVVLMNEFLFHFSRSDAEGDPSSNGSASSPSSPTGLTPKKTPSARAKKNSKLRRKFRVFYEKPRLEAFNVSFGELDHKVHLWNFGTRPTYVEKAVDTDCFRDIRKQVLPANTDDIGTIFSTVSPGDHVDTELWSKKKGKSSEERKGHKSFPQVSPKPPCPWVIR